MGLTFIDTHAHIYAEEFKDDLSDVIARAREASVNTILLPNIDSSTTDALWRTVNSDKDLFIPMMGLHPCSVNADTAEDELAHVESELKKGKYQAVGEIGMDLYWDKSTKEAQEQAFIRQCEWAVELALPVAIHSRDATGELIKLIRDINDPRLTGVFHCFTGSREEADQIIALGFMLGIGGVLTFKNTNLRDTLAGISMEHLVLETDAPYLAPVPYRGKRNESAYVQHVAKTLADTKGISIEDVAAQTTANAIKLFKLKNLPL